MNTDLSLAQSHAFQLSRTLMVSVTLFRSDEEFGVLPSDELDDEDGVRTRAVRNRTRPLSTKDKDY
ncbi:hypothetical protein [Rhizobium sp. CNPSo 3490]|uniref:hypothetical protein n=1 Tax=Rhizobium sp. CNPSo 3490 TaxID=3021407 RepID=UPI00254A5E1D|nr:hypothetical protein [Rhizobium sp. CNPSo 3490]MDK4731496.1 hypothetical protein [Rhizobium sp. CNPSo 3490]